jgi:EAL domain-containing protein (putative c-di-GMP-specific phosphodiesterase class I)
VRATRQIREIGCRFALDDFGTGYGGFHQLKTLPLDFLKIDQEFVRDALVSESDRHVIWAVVNIARRFGLKTVAEGVEDQQTFELLAQMDVDYAQGFHLGRPGPIDSGHRGALRSG